MMRWVVLILFMIGFAPLDIGLTGLVSAVDIDFDCPDKIFVDEEFECVLEVFDGDGEYDVKVDLDEERDSVLKIWKDGKWESGYYYLTDFIEDGEDKDVRLKVSEDGDFDGVLKLRQGDKREFFDIEIEVEKARGNGVELEGGDEFVDSDPIVIEDGPGIISLDDNLVAMENEENGFVYVSKDAKVVDYLPYGFAVFLIFVIGILVWERF